MGSIDCAAADGELPAGTAAGGLASELRPWAVQAPPKRAHSEVSADAAALQAVLPVSPKPSRALCPRLAGSAEGRGCLASQLAASAS